MPAGFAHGFVVLSEAATFFYKVDKFYEPGNEVGQVTPHYQMLVYLGSVNGILTMYPVY